MREAESSIEDARAANHGNSLCYALAGACPTALSAGDLAAAEHYARMLLDHSTRHALPRWNAWGRGYLGGECLPSSAATSPPEYRCYAPDSTNFARPNSPLCVSSPSRWWRPWATPARSPKDLLPSRRRSRNRSTPKDAFYLPGCSTSKASFFCCKADPEPQRRPRTTSGKRSTGRADKAPCPGNCAPPRALPGCCATRTVPLCLGAPPAGLRPVHRRVRHHRSQNRKGSSRRPPLRGRADRRPGLGRRAPAGGRVVTDANASHDHRRRKEAGLPYLASARFCSMSCRVSRNARGNG